MPRQLRYFVPHIPQYVVTRGVDRQAAFLQKQDYVLYLESLREAAKTHHCIVPTYDFMTNHVHLLVTPERDRPLPLLMQAIVTEHARR